MSPQFQSPVPEAKKDQRFLIAFAIVVACAVGFFMLVVPFYTGFTKAIRQGAGAVRADGRSDMPGGGVTIAYEPTPGLEEYNSYEHPDGTWWGVRSADHYSMVELMRISEPPLGTKQAVANFIAEKNRDNTDFAGFNVAAKPTVLNGYHGYEWEYIEGDSDTWVRNVWIPGPRFSYRLRCEAYSAERAQFRALCNQATRSFRITAR